TFSTVLGDDSYRDFVTDDLRNADIEVHAVIDHSLQTVNKNEIVVGGYRLLKVDTLDNRSISDQILEEITGAIKKVPTDAVVFADFRHGLFNRRTAGVCKSLRLEDHVISAHRSHAHYIGKGGNLRAMFAELYGKVDGCASGKGGSMHLIDLSVNFLGCVPIVGSTIPIGVGAAFGAML